jgi:hypothetical protein
LRIRTVDGEVVPPERIDVASPRRSDRVVAVTTQRTEVFEHLASGHVYRPREDLVQVEWAPAYNWMRSQFSKRVKGARGGPLIWLIPFEVADTGILCDSSCGGGLPRCGRLHAFPGHSCLLVRFGRAGCVVFSSRLWELAVHGAYIPSDEADREAFRDQLQRRQLLTDDVYVVPASGLPTCRPGRRRPGTRSSTSATPTTWIRGRRRRRSNLSARRTCSARS